MMNGCKCASVLHCLFISLTQFDVYVVHVQEERKNSIPNKLESKQFIFFPQRLVLSPSLFQKKHQNTMLPISSVYNLCISTPHPLPPPITESHTHKNALLILPRCNTISQSGAQRKRFFLSSAFQLSALIQ